MLEVIFFLIILYFTIKVLYSVAVVAIKILCFIVLIFISAIFLAQIWQFLPTLTTQVWQFLPIILMIVVFIALVKLCQFGVISTRVKKLKNQQFLAIKNKNHSIFIPSDKRFLPFHIVKIMGQ